MKQIVLDLETLGKKPGCVIWAIGAVCFETESPWAPVSEFYELININSSIDCGFTEDAEAVQWWSQQEDQFELKLAQDPHGGLSVQSALIKFEQWLASFETGEAKIWGNSAAFDNEILKAYYERMYIELPWTYKQDMCFRTIKNLFPDCKPDDENDHPHHALYDARFEARWLQRILNKHSLLGAP